MNKIQNKKYKNVVDCATCTSYCVLGSKQQKAFCKDILDLVNEDNCRNGASCALQAHLKTKLQAHSAEVQMMVLFVFRELMWKGTLFMQQTLTSRELLHALRSVLHRPALDVQVKYAILKLIHDLFQLLENDADLFPSLVDFQNEWKEEGTNIKVQRKSQEETRAPPITEHLSSQVEGMKSNAATARGHHSARGQSHEKHLIQLKSDLSVLQQ